MMNRKNKRNAYCSKLDENKNHGMLMGAANVPLQLEMREWGLLWPFLDLTGLSNCLSAGPFGANG